jgi:hypothetical protein
LFTYWRVRRRRRRPSSGTPASAYRSRQSQHVADLSDVAGDDQFGAVAAQGDGEFGQDRGRGDVDERHRLGVEDDGVDGRVGGGVGDDLADVVGVGEEQAALDAQDGDAGDERGVGMPVVVDPGVVDAGEGRHVGPGCPVEQQEQRDADADDQAGEGVEDEDAEHRGQRGGEVGPGGDAVDGAEPAGVRVVRLGRAESSGESDQQDADGGSGEFEVVGSGHVRRPAHGQRDESDGQRGSVGVPEVGDQVPDLGEEVAAAHGYPNSLGSCPAMMVSARPTMNPLRTGSEMKSASNPRRISPATMPASPVITASTVVRPT